jgi:hypothetical protein
MSVGAIGSLEAKERRRSYTGRGQARAFPHLQRYLAQPGGMQPVHHRFFGIVGGAYDFALARS